ncbi:protease FtsH-inhibitory lysogeny factor CIII, partial [Streptococcus pneumoniae]
MRLYRIPITLHSRRFSLCIN